MMQDGQSIGSLADKPNESKIVTLNVNTKEIVSVQSLYGQKFLFYKEISLQIDNR